MGEPEMEHESKNTLLLRLVTKFVEAYCSQVDGRRRNLDLNHLNASARIKRLFDQLLGAEFNKLVAASKLTDKEIDIAIHNSHALHSRHIDYDDAFQELAKREIRNLAPYVSKCTKEVCKEMRHAIDTSCQAIQNQYPMLYQKIKATASELINERFKDCQRYLDDYLNAEASIARTTHGEFRDNNEGRRRAHTTANIDSNSSGSSTESVYTYVEEEGCKLKRQSVYKGRKMVKPVINEEENEFTDDIAFEDAAAHRANVKRDIQKYFDAAKRQIMEHVARGIIYKLVYGTSNKMTEFMLLRLHTLNAEELLVAVNHDEIKLQREMAVKTLSSYEQAGNVVDTILFKIDKL